MPSRERLQTAPHPPTLLQVSYAYVRAGGAAKHVTLPEPFQQQKSCNECGEKCQDGIEEILRLFLLHNRRLIGAPVTRMAKQRVMHRHTFAPGRCYLVALVAAYLVAYAVADLKSDSVAM